MSTNTELEKIEIVLSQISSKELKDSHGYICMKTLLQLSLRDTGSRSVAITKRWYQELTAENHDNFYLRKNSRSILIC